MGNDLAYGLEASDLRKGPDVRRLRAVGGTVTLVVSVLLAASTSTTPVGVTLKMDGNLTNVSGSASVRAQTVSAAGGKIVLQSRPGNGDAAVYPSVGSETGAVLAVTNATGTDVLAPGTRDFSFGADFRTVSGGKNDGDNLIQRGLADDSGQYKIELDSGSAVCVVKGSRKTATVRIGHVIAPNVWYRVNCSRTGSEIALTLTRIDSGAEWRSRTNSVVGSVATKSVGTPLTVGGKLTPKLAIAAWEPDQFNGTIDNAFMRVNR